MKQKILLTLICALAGALSALAANVPYALYSGNQTILTFYYGEKPNGRILLMIVLIQHGMSMVLTVMCFM